MLYAYVEIQWIMKNWWVWNNDATNMLLNLQVGPFLQCFSSISISFLHPHVTPWSRANIYLHRFSHHLDGTNISTSSRPSPASASEIASSWTAPTFHRGLLHSSLVRYLESYYHFLRIIFCLVLYNFTSVTLFLPSGLCLLSCVSLACIFQAVTTRRANAWLKVVSNSLYVFKPRAICIIIGLLFWTNRAWG